MYYEPKLYDYNNGSICINMNGIRMMKDVIKNITFSPILMQNFMRQWILFLFWLVVMNDNNKQTVLF